MNRLALIGILFISTSTFAQRLAPQIMIDQFGYRPDMAKRVVFADPIKGQNASVDYSPGKTFEVRRVDTDQVVYSGPITPWNNGATDELSGDKIWHGDFSSVTEPGRYYILEPYMNERSYPFEIKNDIFVPVMIANLRTFYFQRCGVELPAKFAGNWPHEACHVHPNQQKNATPAKLADGVTIAGWDKQPPRDLSGGWHDAGDYNKYLPYTEAVVVPLLQAYQWNPSAFGDANNIPESGNGVPDIVDEVKFEVDFLLRMQNEDGSVLNRVGGETYNVGEDDPATDMQAQKYTPPTTWATSTFVAGVARAARVMKNFEAQYPGASAKYQDAALKAWAFLEAHPTMLPADGKDSGRLAASGAECKTDEDLRRRMHAAAELFALTGEKKFAEFFETNLKDKAKVIHNGYYAMEVGKFDGSLDEAMFQACLAYMEGPSADPVLVARLREILKATADDLADKYKSGADSYLTWMHAGHYCWGSNRLKAQWGNFLVAAIALKVDPNRTSDYRATAAAYLNAMHGMNALNYCYLSNMSTLGAERSVVEIYHAWFRDGSKRFDGFATRGNPNAGTLGPAPGFLAGGPNQFFSVDWISPPKNEPPMKSYRDWNASFNAQRQANECSWEITEPAIYYQAAYTMLLSEFCK